MIYKNIEIHNCYEMVFDEELQAEKISRIPAKLVNLIKPNPFTTSGVELRFVPLGKVEIELKLKNLCLEYKSAYVYYGSIQSGWEHAVYFERDGILKISVEPSKRIDTLKRITYEQDFPFSPEVVRVFLPVGEIAISKISGDLRPPKKCEVPQKKFLMYGSSITHGSMSYAPPDTYVSRLAQNLNFDYINWGFAGSAFMEREMADLIAQRNDFDFAILEMGINIMNIEYDEYRARTEYFVKTVAQAHQDKKIFCIDAFFCEQDLWDDVNPEKHSDGFRKIMRETVERLGFKNTIYVNGLELLPDAKGLSEDLVHPSRLGIETITKNLTSTIKQYL